MRLLIEAATTKARKCEAVVRMACLLSKKPGEGGRGEEPSTRLEEGNNLSPDFSQMRKLRHMLQNAQLLDGVQLLFLRKFACWRMQNMQQHGTDRDHKAT